MRKCVSACLALVLLGACYADRVVGKAGAPERERPVTPPSAAGKPRLPTLIAPQANEGLFAADPALGDVDGDGLDDFVIQGSPLSGSSDPASWLYLFYGRSAFPEQLSTADADAVFHVEGGYDSTPLGDINGDGLADFALIRSGSTEFVYGSKQRWSGMVTPFAAGPVWKHPDLPPPFASNYFGGLLVRRAHDWNGDGIDDLIVAAEKALPPEQFDVAGGFGAAVTAHLVLGKRGQWASATWDPAWSEAEFGYEIQPPQPFEIGPSVEFLMPVGAGDLDGDGHADLVVNRPDASLYVFYGGRKFAQTVDASQLDAQLEPPAQHDLIGGGDVDGDGAIDLLFRHSEGNALAVVYGARSAGRVQLEPDLVIELLPEQYSIDAAIGDMDGDGSPDLGLAVVKLDGPFDAVGTELTQNRFYIVRGSGERLVGRIRLDEGYLAGRENVPLPDSLPGDWAVRMAGDVDGDGGGDMLTTVPPRPSDPGGVTLIPSAPRPPQ